MEYVMLRAPNEPKNLSLVEGSLRLRSVSPQEEDDDMSTEESDVDPRCMEPK